MRIVGNNPQLSRQTQATASGAITGGLPVVVNTDGTVTQISGSAASIATAVVFEAAATKVPDVCFDSTNNRIVVAYQDDANSDYGTAIVGTVASDGSISFGTPVVFESAATGGSGIAIVHDSNSNKIVIAYEDEGNSQYGTAIVGTVDSSDNSISFGSAAVFESGEATTIDACFDSNSNKVVIAYSDAGNSQYGKAVVGTVSGTSISFGSIVTFESAQTDYVSIAFDSTNNKVIIAYADGGDSGKGKAVVGTVSGTDISFGTVAVFENADTRWTSLAHDSSNQKTVIAYHDAGNSDYPTAIVGTVSGTDISFGTPVVIQSTANYGTATTFDSSINKIIITYNDYDGKDLRIIDGTVSGTSISFGTNALLIEASSGTTLSGVASANHIVRNVFDSNVNKTISVYSEFRNSSYGTAIAYTSAVPTNITSENFIGFAQDTVATGQPVTINTKGAIADNMPQLESASDVLGTAVVYNAQAVNYNRSVFDSHNNRIVVAYADQASYPYKGTVIVGTVSGTSISYGTEVVFDIGNATFIDIAFDSNSNRVVIAYCDGDNGQYGTAIVGTVDPSDNSISFGTPVVFNGTGKAFSISCTFDSSNNKVVITYRDAGNSHYGTAIVGTVDSSDNSISFGTEVVFNSANTAEQSSTFDNSNNKVVIAYQDQGNNSRGTAIVATVDSSDNSISFGTEVDFAGANNTNLGTPITFDSNSNKIVVLYSDGGDSSYGKAKVGTVSGTGISFGSATAFESSAAVRHKAIDFDSSVNKVVIAYDYNETDLKYVVGTVSGTSISFGTAVVFSTGNGTADGSLDVAFDSSNDKSVIVFLDQSNSNYGTSQVFSPAGTLEDLTPAQTYYVQTDGTLSETADDPSVTAGTAVAGSTLIVKG